MLLCHLCLTININKSKNCPVHKGTKSENINKRNALHQRSLNSMDNFAFLCFTQVCEFTHSHVTSIIFISIVFFMNKIIIYKHSYMFKYINRYWKLKHQLLTRFWNPEERSQFRKHQSELSPYSSCSRQA